MHVDTLLALNDINDLKLAEHVLQIGLQLLRLPVAKLFVCLPVIESDDLVTLNHLRTICLFLITLHDTNNSLMPRQITCLEQVLPFGRASITSWHLEKEAILSHKYELRAGSGEIFIHFKA